MERALLEERFRKSENRGRIYGAELDSEIIGAVVGTILEQSQEDQLEHVPSRFEEVQELVVKDGYRGRGIGTALMSRMEEYFKENDCNIAGVGVLAPNKNAHRL